MRRRWKIMLNKYFSLENIREAYDGLKKGKLNPGVQRLSHKNFDLQKEGYFQTVRNKVLLNSYKFSPYQEVLIVKDRYSLPRVISIPSIRDKITIFILKTILEEYFKNHLQTKTVEDIVREASAAININQYNYYFKLDVKDFYGSINHDVLLVKLRSRIRNNIILNLINSAISMVTVDIEATKENREEGKEVGVPQGLAISNILANIYLSKFDKKHMGKSKYAYFRYVDDILVLCNKSNYKTLMKRMEKELLQNYKLHISEKKKEDGNLKKEIELLGYRILPNGKICIRRKNVIRMEKSLEKILNDFKNARDKRVKNNFDLLQWKLNLHITGCKMNNKQYGWVRFFRHCGCPNVFYHLDYILAGLIKRFKLEHKLLINGKYKGKKFSKTYFEIKNNPLHSNYITDFNTYSIQKKKDVLKNVCNRRVDDWTEYKIEIEFNRFIFKSISALEQDLQQIYL